jgi:AcrR family transcriptional regulator
MSTTETAERPLRADAARNRAKVLDAAHRTFAAEGVDAEMAVVAAAAGVGVGTLYRHFPTKDALLAALTSRHFGRLAEIAAEVLAEDLGSWERVESLVWRAAELTSEDSGMCDILAAAPLEASETPEARRLRELTTTIVDSAREAGTIRPDARGDDVPMMMCGFGKVASNQRQGAPVDWRRYLQIMLDGLRAR